MPPSNPLPFPIEVFRRIFSISCRPEQKQLSSVCWQFHALLTPAIFAKITIPVQYLHYPKNLSLLLSLADGRARWSSHVRKLIITPGVPDYSRHEIFEETVWGVEVQLLLLAALTRLDRVREIVWKIGTTRTEWSNEIVSAWTHSLPIRPSIILEVDPNTITLLPILSNVTSLQLSTPTNSRRLTKQLVVQAAHLIANNSLSLKTLVRVNQEIYSFLPKLPSEGFWVRLETIVSGFVSSELNAYLGTYSTLKRVILRHADGARHPDIGDEHAEVFYLHIKMHKRSLREMVVTARWQSQWAFSPRRALTLCVMHALVRLELSVNEEDVIGVPTNDNAVIILLHIVAHLPKLAYLTIRFTQPHEFRIESCVAPYHRRMLSAIRDAVLGFRVYCWPGGIPVNTVVQVGAECFKFDLLGSASQFPPNTASGEVLPRKIQALLPLASHLVFTWGGKVSEDVEAYGYKPYLRFCSALSAAACLGANLSINTLCFQQPWGACYEPANPDITGIGLRVSAYFTFFLTVFLTTFCSEIFGDLPDSFVGLRRARLYTFLSLIIACLAQSNKGQLSLFHSLAAIHITQLIFASALVEVFLFKWSHRKVLVQFGAQTVFNIFFVFISMRIMSAYDRPHHVPPTCTLHDGTNGFDSLTWIFLFRMHLHGRNATASALLALGLFFLSAGFMVLLVALISERCGASKSSQTRITRRVAVIWILLFGIHEIVSIERSLRSNINLGLDDEAENQWGFGQVTAVVLTLSFIDPILEVCKILRDGSWEEPDPPTRYTQPHARSPSPTSSPKGRNDIALVPMDDSRSSPSRSRPRKRTTV